MTTKLDKRLSNKIVLDTETTLEQHVNDIAWTISNKNGNIVYKRYLIKETSENETPFAPTKREYYKNLVDNHELPVVSIEFAISDLINDSIKYNAKMYAYNSKFDFDKINDTLKAYNSDLQLTENVIDIWALSYNTIIQQKSYVRFVRDNNLFTDKHNPKMSAESVYKYISDNVDFEEDHTALSDTIIETEILWRALAQHKKRNYQTPYWLDFKKYYESVID